MIGSDSLLEKGRLTSAWEGARRDRVRALRFTRPPSTFTFWQVSRAGLILPEATETQRGQADFPGSHS